MERIQRKEHLLTEGIKRWKELIPTIIDEMFRSSKPPIKEVVKGRKLRIGKVSGNFHVASINFTTSHVWQSLLENVHYSGSQLLRTFDLDIDGIMYVFYP